MLEVGTRNGHILARLHALVAPEGQVTAIAMSDREVCLGDGSESAWGCLGVHFWLPIVWLAGWHPCACTTHPSSDAIQDDTPRNSDDKMTQGQPGVKR